MSRARMIGSTGLRPPRLTEQQKIAASAARSAAMARAHQRRRDEALRELAMLAWQGIARVYPGGSLSEPVLMALLSRGLVQRSYELTPQGRELARLQLQPLADPERRS